MTNDRRPVSAVVGRSSIVIDQDPLAQYLLAHQGSARCLAATQSAMQAAPLILSTGQSVMAIGGFSGSDNILSVDEFDALVQVGEVRYFLMQTSPQGGNSRLGGGSVPPNMPRQVEITEWVQQNCVSVPNLPIYDCAP